MYRALRRSLGKAAPESLGESWDSAEKLRKGAGGLAQSGSIPVQDPAKRTRASSTIRRAASTDASISNFDVSSKTASTA